MRKELYSIYEDIREAGRDPKSDQDLTALIRERNADLDTRLRHACEFIGLDPYEVCERAAMKEDSDTPKHIAAHEAICEIAEEHGLLHGHIAKALEQNCWLDILDLAWEQWKAASGGEGKA